jgi:threonine dehydrogenase-like Zn-dependent dehydrogenase
MNALQLVRPRTFVPVQVPVPELRAAGPDRLLVRTGRVTMCGSDIGYWSGHQRFRTYPMAPGAPIHECAGEVIDSTSDGFRPGDRVVAIPDGNQGLAEYYVAQAAKAVVLPPELAACESCLIQPLSTVIHVVDRLGDVEGKSVAVVGLGSMGLLLCWLLNKRGAGPIVGIDPLPERCRVAERLGVARTWPVRSSQVVHGTRLAPGEWAPPDICIEAVGHQMDTFNDCLELVRKQGTVVAYGVPDHLVYSIEFDVFFRKNLHLMAAVTPDFSEFLPKGRDLFLAWREELERLVTHRFPITHAPQVFEMYEQHADGVIKVVMDAACWESTAD